MVIPQTTVNVIARHSWRANRIWVTSAIRKRNVSHCRRAAVAIAPRTNARSIAANDASSPTVLHPMRESVDVPRLRHLSMTCASNMLHRYSPEADWFRFNHVAGSNKSPIHARPAITHGKHPIRTVGTRIHNQKSDVSSGEWIPLNARRVMATWNIVVLKLINTTAHGSLLSSIREMRIQIQNVDASDRRYFLGRRKAARTPAPKAAAATTTDRTMPTRPIGARVAAPSTT